MEDEEQSSERGLATRYQLRTDFWHAALEALRTANVALYGNVSPSLDRWLNAGSGASGIYYSMIFNRDEARVEFALGTRSSEANKALFNHLFARRAQLDAEFGEALTWRGMDDKKVSLIACTASFEGHNREIWPEMIDWLVHHVGTMEKVFAKDVPALRNLARTQFPKEATA